MKKTQKIISMVLAVMLLFSCAQALPVSAAEVGAEEAGALPPPHFLFTDSLNWGNVHMYAWNCEGDIGSAWPGDPLSFYEINEYGQAVYEVYCPYGASGVILSNGNGEQTDNITDFNPGGGGYYLDPDKTETNEFGATVYVPVPFDQPVTVPTDPTVKPSQYPYCYDFMFSDSLGWGSVFMYAFNEQGDVGTAWPGKPLSAFEINDYGQTVYGIYVPEGATGVIFNNGKGEQTDNIIDFNPGGGGYFLDHDVTTINEYGATVYVPIPWDGPFTVPTKPTTKPEPVTTPATEPETVPITEPVTSPETEPESSTSQEPVCPPLSFRNTLNWENVFVYAWDSLGNNLSDTWPGDQTSDYQIVNGEQLFCINVPEGAAGIIINNGFDQQTDNITDFYPKGGGYYLDPDKTETNEFGATVLIPIPFDEPVPAHTEPTEALSTEPEPVTSPATEPVTEPTTEPSQDPDAFSFYFNNSLGWKNIFMYAWNENGDVSDAWPGNKLTEYTINKNGEEVYKVTVPSNAIGVVINSDQGQTDNITNFYSNYYLKQDETTFNEFGATIYVPIQYYEFAVYSIGDADGNETININDVTAIQKYLAMAPVPDTFNEDAADVDRNETVNINDATLIQYYLAGMENKNSRCGETVDESTSAYHIPFTDRFNWGNVKLIARDKNGRILQSCIEQDSWNDHFIIPKRTASLVVVSQDGTKQTEPLTDFYWASGFGTYYIAWDKANEKYVLDFLGWGGLIPEFEFINLLGWENVCVTSYDKYGNVEDSFVSEPNQGLKHIISVSVYAKKIVLSNGEGEETDFITQFYGFPGNEYCYYLDKNKTTVNESGKTVYIPLEYKGSQYPNYCTFYFENTLGWEDLHVYAWDENGNVLTAEWQGDKLTDFELNDYGQKIYTVNVPVDAAGVVISGNEGQTDIITDFTPGGGGYYLDPNKTTVNEWGTIVYVPVPWDEKPDETSFYFTNSLNWTDLHVYAWDKNGNALTAVWPGDKLTDFETSPFGGEVYTVSVPKDAIGVIINGNEGQTDNITDFNPGGGYYLFSNHTTVNDFGTTVYIPITFDKYPDETSFYFSNSLNWTDLHIFAWDADGDILTADWPGNKLTEFDLNDFGEEVYTVTVPMDAIGVIISGDEGQTIEIRDFNPDGGYYLARDVTKINESGETVYIPIQWTPSI